MPPRKASPSTRSKPQAQKAAAKKQKKTAAAVKPKKPAAPKKVAAKKATTSKKPAAARKTKQAVAKKKPAVAAKKKQTSPLPSKTASKRATAPAPTKAKAKPASASKAAAAPTKATKAKSMHVLLGYDGDLGDHPIVFELASTAATKLLPTYGDWIMRAREMHGVDDWMGGDTEAGNMTIDMYHRLLRTCKQLRPSSQTFLRYLMLFSAMRSDDAWILDNEDHCDTYPVLPSLLAEVVLKLRENIAALSDAELGLVRPEDRATLIGILDEAQDTWREQLLMNEAYDEEQCDFLKGL